MTSIENRLAALEAESEIRRLKAQYLNACDRKDHNAMSACFSSDAQIDFPPLGKFTVDGLIDIFTQMAVSTAIIDTHHGHNAEIRIEGDRATAVWNLGFATIDPKSNRFRLLTGFYYDTYERRQGKWYITSTRSDPQRIVDGHLAGENTGADLIRAEE